MQQGILDLAISVQTNAMPTITLISTIHEEVGPCNVSTLHEILERARLEVIFVEIPPSCFGQFFKEKTRSNLETGAVNR